MKNIDRITEAYNGSLGAESARLTESSRLRIHWVCSQADGERILDVGCSQGIASIILAREGKTVTGIDICQESIDFAKESLSGEDTSTQNHIEFICTDFISFSANEGIYDSIIMGGILEHVSDTDRFIKRAHARVADGGSLVVTVPFGISDYFDHIRTYYITELYTLLSKYFSVNAVKFFDGWLGITCGKQIGESVINMDGDLFAQAESAFYTLESRLRLQIKELTKSVADGNLKIEQLQKEEDKYDALANSKLGRIQLGIWRRRNEKKHKKDESGGFWASIKWQLKKNNVLVFIVRKLRGQNVTMRQLKQEKKPSMLVGHYDLSFMDRIKPLLDAMPTSGAGRFYKKAPHRIAMISDEFFYDAFKDAAEVIVLHPLQWQEQLRNIDMLLVVTTWKGVNEKWKGFARRDTKIRRIIFDIINYCKKSNIPAVFYSKEDPPNYKIFVDIAQRCDYVFTTADEMIPEYKKDCGHDRIYSLMLGINPLYHNPVGSQSAEKLSEVIFSGSWMDKYQKRVNDMNLLFKGVRDSGRGLKIIDRNYSLNDPRYTFPNQYKPFISPKVPHELLQKVHKLYDWALNINSVKDSQTMFANRTFELEASGNILISNYSVGVNFHLPFVYTVRHSKEIGYILNTFSKKEIWERQSAGIRHAMTGHTCFDRYNELCGKIGLGNDLPRRKVAVVTDRITETVQKMFGEQTYADKELITEDRLAERYSDFDMIAFFNENMEYEMFYLEDMINAFKYTDSDYITKDSYYTGETLVDGKQHDFVQTLHSKYCAVFWREAFPAATLLEMRESNITLINGYSIDCLNFNVDPQVTTRENREYKLSVIIPVYNNGSRLYGKAFSSLRRSSMFGDMEILLIDDGSTDGITEKYAHYLEKRYDNVRTFFFMDGGSGSASRPRNKGVELASAEYVTFLDPDNEAVNDGYSELYNLAVDGMCDLTVGTITTCRREESSESGYYNLFVENCGSDTLTGDKKEFLRKISFTPMSIQGMVIEKKLITSNGFVQVEGAVGQDSLFSWQLIANAGKVKALNLPIHIYYAAIEGSTVNNIGRNYFQRALTLEPPRIKWLTDEGLLQDYMDLRFNHYFKNWTLRKLSICKPEETAESTRIVGEIFMLYHDYYNGKEEAINAFVEVLFGGVTNGKQ